MDLSQETWSFNLQNDKNAVVLDVRTVDEFADGIIPNAINIDIFKGQGFIYKLEELDKSNNFYVYCKAGSRSAQACNIMNQLGFNNTFNLVGGIMQWHGEIIVP